MYRRKVRKASGVEKSNRKEYQHTKAQAEEYIQDESKVIEILQKFKEWFSLKGEIVQCAMLQLGKNLSREYALDILKDSKSPFSDAEHYVLYEVVTHYGDRSFSFANILSLIDSFKSGEIQTIGQKIGLLKSNLLPVSIYTINGSIPYNPLNMHLTLNEETTIQQLIHHVKSEFEWPSREIKLYQNAECDQIVDESTQLNELIPEKIEEKSEGVELFMDYTVGYIDNPLILSDHYFEDRTVEKVIESLRFSSLRQ